jgi:hypothetical protein
MSGYAPDFDWATARIAVPGQPAIAVFIDADGQVIIRQQGAYGVDDDAWVTVHPDNVEPLLLSLIELIGCVEDAESAPLSGAERARRYRNRKRERHADRHAVTDKRDAADGEVLRVVGGKGL